MKWLGVAAAALVAVGVWTTGCGGGGASRPALPVGADAAVAARSLALDQAAESGNGSGIADFYAANYTDDQHLTKTTVLQAIQQFLARFTIVGESHRQSALQDSGAHVIETWSDTVAVRDKTAGNAASSLDEGEIDSWRWDSDAWRIDRAAAPPGVAVQRQAPLAGRFRRG